jgi:hypothetical protein
MKEKIDKLSSSKIKTFSAECYRGSGEKIQATNWEGVIF